MGISSASPSDDPKQKIVMGYPSMDRYHQAQNMYPQAASAYPAPCRPQGYASSSFQLPQGYDSSPFQQDGKYLASTSQNPYPQPYNDCYYQQHYKPLCPNPTITPRLAVFSLKVSNFTATNTTLTGIWDVDVAVSNTNKELAIHFDGVMSSIFYKDALLGISALQPFQVQQMQRSALNFSMPAEQTPNDHRLQNWVLPALSQDRSNGVVVFSLRLAMKANFTSPNMVYRQESLRVLCENMQISFSPTGEGTMLPGLGNACLIHLQESLKKLYIYIYVYVCVCVCVCVFVCIYMYTYLFILFNPPYVL
ncbi:hypothetical protein Pfo_028398 [Paulownia fortunei]|nr:hypothetical protein Pfo_028398 [Paulownia fortunei]